MYIDHIHDQSSQVMVDRNFHIRKFCGHMVHNTSCTCTPLLAHAHIFSVLTTMPEWRVDNINPRQDDKEGG